jgi:NAD(P)-dependent dehydrogenase (short-subunit alcohol dehydrogenase family)
MKPAALITGATSRLGAALAVQLSDRYDLILHHSPRSKIAATELVKSISHKDSEIFLVEADLAVTSAADDLISRSQKLHPDLRLIINNASIYEPGSDALHLKKILQVNAYAALSISRQFLENEGSGDIITITDASDGKHNSAYSNYYLSKLKLRDDSLKLALALAPSIKLNMIAPGPLLPAKGREDLFEEIVRSTPLHLCPGLDAVLKSVDFILASPWMTGQIIFADAGQHLQL